ncbi:CGNR zinc finger domain-containing protein [Deinococcus oregonensis]|uniref:CGNR zinc finger domain-containing protein n=1 Tax=Deinococcus oregonensis TaxID=1805970 RepID=A0ABV6AVW6_9DEIO
MSDTFEFIGGDPSVDLVNTQMHRQAAQGADELLTSGEAAARWFTEAGLLSSEEAKQMDADAALLAAKRLRAALDAVYRPMARGQEDGPDTERGLLTLNAVLDQGRERVQVARENGKFTRGARLEILGPLDPSVRVARAAADLLHRMEAHRLKECENPECDLLFYDDSRNASRRWCSMQGCGNQQKQARFRRAARTPSATSA